MLFQFQFQVKQQMHILIKYYQIKCKQLKTNLVNEWKSSINI